MNRCAIEVVYTVERQMIPNMTPSVPQLNISQALDWLRVGISCNKELQFVLWRMVEMRHIV